MTARRWGRVIAVPTTPRGPLDAPLQEQRALLQLQAHDSAIDRLDHRRGSLPEDARLAELADALAAVDQLSAEREGKLATVQRDQSRLEHEIDTLRQRSGAEERRLYDGSVANARELDSITHEVDNLKKRRSDRENSDCQSANGVL